MARLEYQGKKQMLLGTTQKMNQMLIELSETHPDFVLGEEQEKRLIAEARLRFGLPTEIIQQSIDDMVITGRFNRIGAKTIPKEKPELSVNERIEIKNILGAKPSED
jgi:hypothetical protein